MEIRLSLEKRRRIALESLRGQAPSSTLIPLKTKPATIKLNVVAIAKMARNTNKLREINLHYPLNVFDLLRNRDEFHHEVANIIGTKVGSCGLLGTLEKLNLRHISNG